MRRRILLTFTVALATAGCAPKAATVARGDRRPTIVAVHAEVPVTVDGRLDEPVWQRAPAYTLGLAADREATSPAVRETGHARLAWNDQYLYLAVDFEDSDILADGDADQLPHWQLGDLCELFLKPEGQSWYWELYVTPRGHKTSYRIPRQGHTRPMESLIRECGITVAAEVDGTINDSQDRDRRWTAELAMPVRDLATEAVSFGPANAWRVLIARYDYSPPPAGSPPELTMTPRLSRTNYHLVGEYAVLRLEP